MKIAISGKGGVGKTTVSANLAKLFAQRGYKVLAVDADPDSSLGTALGFSGEELGRITPIADVKEIVDESSGGAGALYVLNPDLNGIIDKYSLKTNGIRFLRMGGVKQGGTSCYCRENTFLHALVTSLLLDNRDAVILDMSAGIEHLTRGTSSGVDLMLVVTEPSITSVNTARIVERLARDLRIGNIGFIANKVGTQAEEQFIKNSFNAEELIGILHYDPLLREKAMGIGLDPASVDNKELEAILGQIVPLRTN